MLKDNYNLIVKSAVKSAKGKSIKSILGELGSEIVGEFGGSIAGNIVGKTNVADQKSNGNQYDKSGKKEKNKKQGQKKKELIEKLEKEEREKQELEKKIASMKAAEAHLKRKQDLSIENMTTENLRNAMMWSEILGDPVCKRRRSRKR